MNKNMTLLLATGIDNIDNVIAKKLAPELGYEVLGSIGYRNQLATKTKELSPDLLIISKALSGTDTTVLEAILTTKRECPNTRIIFLAGEIDIKNKERTHELATLVMAGIYDILTEKSIELGSLKSLITTPRDREQVQYLLKYETAKANIVYEDEIVEMKEEEESEDIVVNGYTKLYIVSSIKPGTGKSFVSTNLATAIAKYGRVKEDGKQPKVAIIEADLQNLSVGTILQIEDNEKNLKTVMDAIASIFDSNGCLIDNVIKIREVNNFIKSSFKPYKNLKNLSALVGSQLSMSDVENIKPVYYKYLIDTIVDDYDIIIMDTNSSLAHITTYPLLRMCNTAFYIIDLDFNNIRNNVRYQKELDKYEVLSKVRYVLNQDITQENRKLTGGKELVESLDFNSDEVENIGFTLVSKIPELPKEVFLNRLFNGTPVILDDNDYTLKVRIELSKIADFIWGVDNMDYLNKEFEEYKEKSNNGGQKKKGFFNR